MNLYFLITGKTNLMLEIIKVFGKTFHNVLIITRNPTQPLMLQVESLFNRSVKTIHYKGGGLGEPSVPSTTPSRPAYVRIVSAIIYI